jgi:hypothetical protein
MGRSMFAYMLAAFALLWTNAFANADQVGTAAQAKAMLWHAIEALKANEDDAITAFNDKNNEQFHALDLYVFCINLSDGKFTAQLEPSLIGTDAQALKLKEDAFGQRLYYTLREAPDGVVISVAYKALRPGTSSGPVPKVSFVARVGRQGCGVGYYQ